MQVYKNNNIADTGPGGRKGWIQIPLATVREVASNDIQALAAHGGIMAKDSTPIFEFVNGDTDSQFRLRWAGGVADAIAFQTVIPPDLDINDPIYIKLYAAMAGATDTPTIASDVFFDVGDTKVEDASGAVTGTTVANYTITIAAADVPAEAHVMAVELTPAAHATDALYVYGIWLEYTSLP